MPRNDKLLTYKTKVKTHDNGYTVVTYHSTEIVSFNSHNIILNFGGWDSVTTRRKMNQASRQFNLGYSVSRAKGITYIIYGNPLEYGGVNVPYDGNIVTLDRKLYALGKL